MVRMDYATRPKAKLIGGIPIYSISTMLRISESLLRQGYVPLFHPNLDRFADLYSVGLLLVPGDDAADVEVVGKGFDAGDLRLGMATPHETLRLNLLSGSCARLRTISSFAYQRERMARATRIRDLRTYTEFANESGELFSDLTKLQFDPNEESISEDELPAKYKDIPEILIQKLLKIAKVIKAKVLGELPSSKAFVASLSWLPNDGWYLWDIYGDWYRR